jgi:hypothetical protein
MIRRLLPVFGLTALVSGTAAAQTATPAPAEQVAAAVLPLPEDLRAGATVHGYAADRRLAVLRRGTGAMVCLADDPAQEAFHVACYHRALEPFMARGRELRAGGVARDRVDSLRFAEVRAGKLAMPREPAMLYSLTGPAGSYDARTGTAPGARRLFVTYIPGATVASTGLSAQPAQGAPWIMYPGTPKAHIMFTVGM